MKNYMVRVCGRNFRMLWQDGKKRERPRLTGFITTRFVRARDAEDAEFRAMDLIRSDKTLGASVRNPASDPPVMFAEEVVQVRSFKSPGGGYIFFHGRGAGRPRSFTEAKRSTRKAAHR
jgi:hypothetical protein